MKKYLKRKSGVLMHISSLYGEYSSGAFGKEAFGFIDFLAKCGFSYWQVLPFCLVDECNSPYKSYSVFGGNPYFIDLDTLFEKGLVTAEELTNARQHTPYSCEYQRLYRTRVPLLIEASKRLDAQGRLAVEEYIASDRYLLEFCEFMALKSANDEKAWYEWSTKEYDGEVLFGWKFIQYEFFTQWARVKEYARKNGIEIIGDMPIYVSLDSADVYFNRELFRIGEDNRLTEVAGVPPDYFSADGQLWGNPLYDWDAMEKTGFTWWRDRLSHALSLFDGVRIDHFRGIESYWAVPGDETTAKNGVWRKGPGMKLIKELKDVAGEKLIIAEDLGDITEDVVKLVQDSGFPGMRVFQFGFLSPGDTPHRPHNYINNCVAYSGTHDNNTLLGYLWETEDAAKQTVLRYCVCPSESWDRDGCFAVIRTITASAAGITVFPIQDIFGYGSDTRLNIPGKADGNWQYRITREQLMNVDTRKYLELNRLYGRA